MSRAFSRLRSIGASTVLGISTALLCLFLTCPYAQSGETAADAKWAPGEALFRLKSSAPFEEIDRIGRDSDADLHEEIAEVGFDTIRRIRSRSKNTDALIQALQRNPHVAYAEPNYIVSAIIQTPNDPSYSQLWGLTKIQAGAAWDNTTGDNAVVVGVVDTGVDYTHVDLSANIWSNSGSINGCPPGTHGYNAITKSCDPMDDNNHGTHVSGTIGAVGNNGTGVTGVNWRTAILGLKFLGKNGSGYTSDAITAIDWAVRAKDSGVNVRVLNNSWGGGGFSQALLDEINKAGERDILFVTAAGNNGSNNDSKPSYPASYGTANEIAVAATDQDDHLASFSNYGANTVDLGAPGVSILSTVPGNAYSFYSGTSMATPHVSGAAALVLAACDQTVAELKSTILSNVDLLASLYGQVQTGGRLNVYKAIQNCATIPSTADFSLSISPSSIRVGSRGGIVTYNVTIVRTGDFADNVAFKVTGLNPETGISYAFNPVSTSGNSSVLTVTVNSTTPAGNYPFTVTGTSGPLSHPAAATLVKGKGRK
jgi:subtilisin family serine protease